MATTTLYLDWASYDKARKSRTPAAPKSRHPTSAAPSAKRIGKPRKVKAVVKTPGRAPAKAPAAKKPTPAVAKPTPATPAAPPTATKPAAATSVTSATPEQSQHLQSVADGMQTDERKALEDGWAAAQKTGFTGTLGDFLVEQAALYQHAEEGDPRLKTWFSADTLKKITSGPGKALIDAAVAKQTTPPAAPTEKTVEREKVQARATIGKPYKLRR